MQRENGPGVTEDSFMLLTVITGGKKKCSFGKHFIHAFKLEMCEQNETIS